MITVFRQGDAVTLSSSVVTLRKRPGRTVEVWHRDARGRHYRPDRQVHVDQSVPSLEPEALAFYQAWHAWLTDHPTTRYWGQTHSKWVVRVTLNGPDDAAGIWATLGVVPAGSVLPPLDTFALAERPGDPIEIAEPWQAVIPDPEVSLEARLWILEALDVAAAQGWQTVGVIQGASADDVAAARPKTTLYLTGHPSGWVGVMEVFWARGVVFPPYGLPMEPVKLPSLRAKRVVRTASPKTESAPAATQLALWATDEPAAQPALLQVTRDVAVLEAELVDTLARIMRGRAYVIVPFSGGKDSTTVLHGAVRAAERLAAEGECPKLVALNSDTGVENPALTDHVRRLFHTIRTWAERSGVPVDTEIVQPDPDRSFWAQVIGRGYTPPNRLARWCTRTLKLEPNESYVKALAERFPGETGLLLLGTRDDESAVRAASNARHAVGDDTLWASSGIPHLAAATPIRTWQTSEVFDLLSEMAAPWGGDYLDLIRLYRHSSGECPIAIQHLGPDRERSTQTLFQSCGTQPGRMGCWSCSVVSRDSSLERLSADFGGIYDGHLRVRAILVAVGDPRWGLRTGWQRTREVDLWQQGFGEIDGVASAWLLHALAEENIWLTAAECDAIVDAWFDREMLRGEVRIPELGWAALERHRAQAQSSVLTAVA